MSLDLIEFFLSVEQSFNLRIPDSDAEELTTPALLIDYLARQLKGSNLEYSLTEKAFRKLQSALSSQLDIPSSSISPSTSLISLLPKSGRDKSWAAIGDYLGATRWPKIGESGWFINLFCQNLDSLDQVIDYIVTYSPSIIKEANEGWTKSQIKEVVHRLIVSELPVDQDGYTEESRFIDDMGVS